MANTRQAKKRARQAEVRRAHNTSQRSHTRTLVKKVVRALESGSAEAAETAYREAVPVLDRMSHRGIIHRNTAARHKSRLSSRIRSLKTSAGAG